MAAVEVHDLVVRHGAVTAVDGLDLEASASQVTVVLGPNGAGKTSTIEVLEGYRMPDRGNVRVLGLDPVRDHRALSARIGVMLQAGGVHPGLRPLEVLRHAAALYHDPLEPVSLIERVGLTGREGRTWRQLSGGEQRRLCLALALVGRPAVAFLDEPTSGVDPQGRLIVRSVIADLRAAGVAVVLTTHDLDEAERVADSLVIVDRGRLVASGTLRELLEGRDEVSFGGPHDLDVVALSAHLGGIVVRASAGERYLVEAPGTPALLAALTAWLAERDLALDDLRAGAQRLEDVYLRLIGVQEGAG